MVEHIHHVATSIRIETILDELVSETHQTISRLYPEKIGSAPAVESPQAQHELNPKDFRSIESLATGYVQRVDPDALMDVAKENDLIVKIEAGPGKFLIKGDLLFSVLSSIAVEGKLADQLRATLVFGRERTPEQDLAFSVRRIVEIAQRALSPGTNDPTTALYCIDRLSEALLHVAGRRHPEPHRFDEKGQLRVIAMPIALDDLASETLKAVARYAMNDAEVQEHLRCATARILAMPAGAHCARLRQFAQEFAVVSAP